MLTSSYTALSTQLHPCFMVNLLREILLLLSDDCGIFHHMKLIVTVIGMWVIVFKVHLYLSSSSYYTDSSEFADSLQPSVFDVYCSWQVLLTAFYDHSKLMYVSPILACPHVGVSERMSLINSYIIQLQ